LNPKKALDDNWRVDLTSQMLLFGEEKYDLQEVFGAKHAPESVSNGLSKESVFESALSTNGNAKQCQAAATPSVDDGCSECIICMSEPRDTLVLPCRHMAFCSYCAGIMRFQCEKCPICRQLVTSLLQFKRGDKEGGENLPKVLATPCKLTAA